jgi:hypothetical protein
MASSPGDGIYRRELGSAYNHRNGSFFNGEQRQEPFRDVQKEPWLLAHGFRETHTFNARERDFISRHSSDLSEFGCSRLWLPQLGPFCEKLLQQFGELPSETLKRAKR